ncbi:MAG: DUF1145 domain-containing protein [Aeromonas sp.]
MKKLFNLLAIAMMALFWFGVLGSLVVPLPGKLNDLLPICGGVVLLMHWVQARMVKRSCEPYFTVSTGRYLAILLFGVFAMLDIRAKLKAIVEQQDQ